MTKACATQGCPEEGPVRDVTMRTFGTAVAMRVPLCDRCWAEMIALAEEDVQVYPAGTR